MKKRILGRTGLEVTQVSFGAMELRGRKVWSGRPISDDQARELLTAVLDAGINFIDTSVDYGDSEDFIGRHISSRRGEYFLATKCGCDPQYGLEEVATPHTWTRETLMWNIDSSLKRLRTDHVDVLQLHNPTVDNVREGHLVEVLKDIQSEGLTRFIGVSTTLPHLLSFLEMGVFDTFQVPYSALNGLHHDAITMLGAAGAGVIIRGGISQGGPASAQPWRFRGDIWLKAGLDELCQDMSPTELLLRYTLSHPYCHTTIIGTLDLRHLRENLDAAAKGPLPAELVHEIRQRVADAIAAMAKSGA
jgi:aryl-alcohol dehydrogenase-like predicted oxidoreductase